MSAQLQESPKIRRMILSDLDAVVAIEREVFLFPWTRGNFSDSIELRLSLPGTGSEWSSVWLWRDDNWSGRSSSANP